MPTADHQPAPPHADQLQEWLSAIEAHAARFQLAAFRVLRRGYDRDVSPSEFKSAVRDLADALRDVRSLTTDLNDVEKWMGD
jgi:hypothetical protein